MRTFGCQFGIFPYIGKRTHNNNLNWCTKTDLYVVSQTRRIVYGFKNAILVQGNQLIARLDICSVSTWTEWMLSSTTKIQGHITQISETLILESVLCAWESAMKCPLKSGTSSPLLWNCVQESLPLVLMIGECAGSSSVLSPCKGWLLPCGFA